MFIRSFFYLKAYKLTDFCEAIIALIAMEF